MKPEAEGKDDACLGPPKASASPGVRPACAGARAGEWVKPISLQARRAGSRSSCHLVRCKAQGVLEDKRQVLLSSGSLWGSLALGSPPKPATYSASPQGLAAAGFFTVPRAVARTPRALRASSAQRPTRLALGSRCTECCQRKSHCTECCQRKSWRSQELQRPRRSQPAVSIEVQGEVSSLAQCPCLPGPLISEPSSQGIGEAPRASPCCRCPQCLWRWLLPQGQRFPGPQCTPGTLQGGFSEEVLGGGS